MRWQWKVSAALALTVGALASAAILVNRNALRAAQRYPATGKFLVVDGVRLHFIDTGGADQVVVLLHGNGGMIADMEISGLVDQLARRNRVIVFDRPGFGHSQRPRRKAWTPERQATLFRDALHSLGIERPIVFGHSWGALVALAMALDFPDEVGALVLASGYYFPTARPDAAIFGAPSIPVIGDVLRHTVLPLVGRFVAPSMIKKMFAPMRVTWKFKAEFPLDLTLRPAQIRASAEEARLMVPAAARLQQRYANLRIPVTILAGRSDKVVDPADHSFRLHDSVPGSRLQVLPGLGHMLHHFGTATIVQALQQVSGLARQRPEALNATPRSAAGSSSTPGHF